MSYFYIICMFYEVVLNNHSCVHLTNFGISYDFIRCTPGLKFCHYLLTHFKPV